MRVDELTGIKHLRGESPAGIVDWLHKEFQAGRTKLRLLGRGSNGVALTNGTDVFKFWMFDSAYEDFVEYCLANPDNPWLPKFKSRIKTIPRVFANLDVWDTEGDPIDATKVRYVKMELLSPYKKGGFKVFTNPKIAEIIEEEDDLANYVSVDTLMQSGQEFSGDPRKDAKTLIWIMTDVRGHDAPYIQYAKYINPELIGFCSALGDVAKKALHGEQRFDAGGRNLAQRGDQIVILDPLVDDGDMELNERFLFISDIVLKKSETPA
jgi:hypothetical protein